MHYIENVCIHFLRAPIFSSFFLQFSDESVMMAGQSYCLQACVLNKRDEGASYRILLADERHGVRVEASELWTGTRPGERGMSSYQQQSRRRTAAAAILGDSSTAEPAPLRTAGVLHRRPNCEHWKGLS